MKDNLSPEEKLLNLIKGKKTPKGPALSTAKPDVQYSAKSLPGAHLTFPHIQKLMLALTGISLIYLLAVFLYPWFGFNEIKLSKAPDDKPEITLSGLELEKKTKPYEFYLQGLGKRQIFSANFAQEETTTSPGVDTDLIKHINLVGIISGENPQAVIEDKNIHKTYYLNKGQSIGELQIEDIKEGRVILNCKGQRYELYL